MKAKFSSILATAITLTLVTGCSVLEPKDDPTRHFMLSGSVQDKLTTKSGLKVLIGPVTVPAYLDHKEIVTASSGQELVLADYHVWAESLDRAISRVLSKNVSYLLDSPSVAPSPDLNFECDYQVTVVVRNFEMRADETLRLETSFIVDGAIGSLVEPAAKSNTITVDVANPQDHGSIAQAMSGGLDQLSRVIAGEILDFHRKSENSAAAEDAARDNDEDTGDNDEDADTD